MHGNIAAASRRRVSFGLTALAAASLLGCGSPGKFPLREPVWRDADLRPISLPCRKAPDPKDPNHVACSPEEYVSPLAWDAAHNSVFRPLAQLFAFDDGGEAVNVNSFDEVPDSAWFTARLGHREIPIEEFAQGACKPELILDGEHAADGSWVIDHGKDNGSSPGFRVKIAGKGKYLFKADSKEQPERPSGASVMGAAVYHAAGYNTSCEQVVYFKRSALKLTPGLKVTNNTGITKAFDQKALEHVFSECATKGEYIRMQASSWLPGKVLGPFRYEGTRKDDPNDRIPHENRRELRGTRLLAAWIHHFDAREQNSMDSWIATNKKVDDSSPGFVRHYFLDTSDCFGSEWDWDEVSRRMGHSYLLDVPDIGEQFVTLGAIEQPWDRATRAPGHKLFGYYTDKDFDASKWKNEYPNPAFSRMTERDGAWMARILARFTPEMVHTLAEMGRFSDPANTEYLARMMQGRLDKLLTRYLSKLSPVTDIRLDGDKVCGLDLARLRGVGGRGVIRYQASLHPDGAAAGQALPVEVGEGGRVCVALPHIARAAVATPSAAPYAVLRLVNRADTGPLDVHLYDLGPGGGYRIAGIDRPER